MVDSITLIPVPKQLEARRHISPQQYREMYEHSITDPETFWATQAREFLDWQSEWHTVLRHDYRKAEVAWFLGGKLNASVNCVDRHAEATPDKIAVIWEGNEPGDTRHISYAELLEQVSRFANVLKTLGVRKGDRVAIYMPMIPETACAMLACARIGAVHSVVFAGFSAGSLRDRIIDSTCSVVITSNVALRGPKTIELKEIVDAAVDGLECVRHVLVHQRTDAPVVLQEGRDQLLGPLLAAAEPFCAPVFVDSEDPLFILYTSGSTGKPKGVLHTTAGYLLYSAITHKYVFDCHKDDIYFCSADIGWVTGHSYVVYGPLANGATTLMFESTPVYPDAGRFWDVIERHRVSIFYTAPTAIRTLEREGDAFVTRYDRSSLRVLGSVGEPINEDAWLWYSRVVGEDRCAVVDTWWQTETGGILISPLAGAIPARPGYATLPFFGVQPCIVDEAGIEIKETEAQGRLCISFPWPGQMRTVYGDHERFYETYFSQFPGKYFTGDGCIRDANGYYRITGRVDDVLNVSGHRIGTAELESAIIHSGCVVEAAVVGFSHPIKGTGIYAFCISLGEPFDAQAAVTRVREAVRQGIGPFATPDIIQFVPGLPKTRSGKIMRRILRAIAEGEHEALGDISTLAEPSIVDAILGGATPFSAT